MRSDKNLIAKLVLTFFWIFFCYKPEIKLDTSNTYTIAGVLEKKINGRSTDYVIRVPNPHNNKTVFDHDVYKYPWFTYGYDSWGANNHVFCENEETLAILNDKVPVQVRFAKNTGGLLKHSYMVLEVTRNGSDVECYSKVDTGKRYNQIWLDNFSFMSIFFMFLGLTLIWFCNPFNFLSSDKDK